MADQKDYELVLYTLRDCFRDINRPTMIRASIDLVEEMLKECVAGQISQEE